MVLRLSAALGLPAAERDRLLLDAGFAPRAAVALDLALPRTTALAQMAFEAAIALDGAATAEAAADLAAAALARIGIDQFMTGTMHRDGARWRIARDAVGRPAIGWLRHIELNDYRDRDILVAQTGARYRGFFWDEVDRARMTPVQRRIIDEGADFRIRSGFVMPIQRADGSVRAFSSWAELLESDATTRTAASLIATALMETLDRLEVGNTGDAPARLPPMPAAMLGWLAAGGSLATFRDRHAMTLADSATLAGDAAVMMGSSCPLHAAARATAMGLIAA